jgi:hypothetical protein
MINVPQINSCRRPAIGVFHPYLKMHHDTDSRDVPPATDQRQHQQSRSEGARPVPPTINGRGGMVSDPAGFHRH